MSHLDQVEKELKPLAKFIKRLGERNDNGQYVVKFAVLFDDYEVANTFEALVRTLKAARKRQIIDFKGEMLLRGLTDDEPITLLIEDADNDEEDTKENDVNNMKQAEYKEDEETIVQQVLVKPSEKMRQKSLKKASKPTILPRAQSFSPSPTPRSPSISLAESVETPVVEQDVVVKEEEKLDNQWGEEFTSKLGKCVNETFEYDKESILAAKYLLHFLKKRIGFDFKGQTKHRDALQFVCVEQFGWKAINDWGYSLRVVKS